MSNSNIRQKTYSWFIGIDVSKDWLDYAIVRNGQQIFHQRDKNHTPDILAFIKALEEKVEGFGIADSLFCMEESGVYCYPALNGFQELKADVVVENALRVKRSLGLVRGKDDRSDAFKIASYAERNVEGIRLWEARRPILRQLQNLVAVRERLISVVNMLKTPLREQQKFVARELFIDTAAMCNGTLKATGKDVIKIEKAIRKLIRSDERLKRLIDIVSSVRGIGIYTAIQMVICTNEFLRIRCPKKFACYAGVAPFKQESGKFIRRARVSQIANKQMKSLLHLCALSAIRWDKEIKAYYERKTKTEGKNKMLVINAIRFKLILRAFACVNQNRLFMPEPPRLMLACENYLGVENNDLCILEIGQAGAGVDKPVNIAYQT